MTQGDRHVQPLIHSSVLKRLEEPDSKKDVYLIIAQKFVELQPDRIKRLTFTLTTGDLAGAKHEALTLRTSSETVGALRLLGKAEALERALHKHCEPAHAAPTLHRLAIAHIRGIKECSQRTICLLCKYLQPHEHRSHEFPLRAPEHVPAGELPHTKFLHVDRIASPRPDEHTPCLSAIRCSNTARPAR